MDTINSVKITILYHQPVSDDYLSRISTVEAISKNVLCSNVALIVLYVSGVVANIVGSFLFVRNRHEPMIFAQGQYIALPQFTLMPCRPRQ